MLSLHMIDGNFFLLHSEWIQYRLDGFLPHYALFEKLRGPGILTSGRLDAYLYGWTKRFRSPDEFFEQAWWLYNAKQGKCKCKYCIPTEWVAPRKKNQYVV